MNLEMILFVWNAVGYFFLVAIPNSLTGRGGELESKVTFEDSYASLQKPWWALPYSGSIPIIGPIQDAVLGAAVLILTVILQLFAALAFAFTSAITPLLLNFQLGYKGVVAIGIGISALSMVIFAPGFGFNLISLRLRSACWYSNGMLIATSIATLGSFLIGNKLQGAVLVFWTVYCVYQSVVSHTLARDNTKLDRSDLPILPGGS